MAGETASPVLTDKSHLVPRRWRRATPATTETAWLTAAARRPDIRLTATFAADPFVDVDGHLRSAEQYANLGFGLLNSGPFPGNPDPAGWVKRLGDEVIPCNADACSTSPNVPPLPCSSASANPPLTTTQHEDPSRFGSAVGPVTDRFHYDCTSRQRILLAYNAQERK
ncbi:hypothetical protein [Mycolicibacterium aromaticivorans]|uniref:hypothetical protein n=1 Tax=Mycolicibacterium aromaticivorans TaxID=318425 RepID=UPI00103966D0|nr:hypothetical protein [Mycolicibacterium aromaticivorans]